MRTVYVSIPICIYIYMRTMLPFSKPNRETSSTSNGETNFSSNFAIATELASESHASSQRAVSNRPSVSAAIRSYEHGNNSFFF